MIAILRCFEELINSSKAQSSSTKLKENMSIRKVQYTMDGGRVSFVKPSHNERRISIGNPYTSHKGNTLRIGVSEVNSHV
jgi:hypothetical protein